MTGGKMIDLVAELAGLNKSEVRKRALHLREADLMPKGLRGRGAPNVNQEHAARLLVSMLSDLPQVRAAQAWQELGLLPWMGIGSRYQLEKNETIHGEIKEEMPEEVISAHVFWKYEGNFGEAVTHFLNWLGKGDSGPEWFQWVTKLGAMKTGEEQHGFFVVQKMQNAPIHRICFGHTEIKGFDMGGFTREVYFQKDLLMKLATAIFDGKES